MHHRTSLALVFFLSACGNQESSSSDSPSAPSPAGGGTTMTTEDMDALGTGGNAPDGPDAPTPDDEPEPPADRGPGLFPVVYEVEAPTTTICNDGSGTVSNATIFLGQTHLQSPGHPFEHSSAGRPLTVALSATGSGEAPLMEVAAYDGVDELGRVCLEGPAELPGVANIEESYRGTLPREWVRPGIRLAVNTGVGTEELTPVVRPEAHLTLVTMDAILFGEGEVDPNREALMAEMAARSPGTELHIIHNPFGVWSPRQLLIGPRDDGRTPEGDAAPHGALLVDEWPNCDDGCTQHSGFGLMSAILDTLSTFANANGMRNGSTWYADHGVNLGGGLGGGHRGTGDDWALFMNHEVGHAWGFPHWASTHTDYPYAGEVRESGGFGVNWGIDQTTGELWSPLCDGQERQSPMQRGNNCLLEGRGIDPFTDYESARLSRMIYGGETTSGTVQSGQGSSAYTLPGEAGRDLLEFSDEAMSVSRFDQETGAFEEQQVEGYLTATETMVPVTMFYGAVDSSGLGHIEGPIEYIGNLASHVDPATADGLTFMKDNYGTFYWGHDFTVRLTLDDGSQVNHLFPGELLENRIARFALNLPRDVADDVTRVDLISRPFRNVTEAYRLTDADTPDNFYSEAEVLLTWEP